MAAEVWGPLPRVENHCTLAARAAVRIGRDLRDLFVGAYGMFAARCRAIDEPGLAVIGVEESTGRPAGVMTLLARVQRYVAGDRRASRRVRSLPARSRRSRVAPARDRARSGSQLGAALDPDPLSHARPAHQAGLRRRERSPVARPALRGPGDRAVRRFRAVRLAARRPSRLARVGGRCVVDDPRARVLRRARIAARRARCRSSRSASPSRTARPHAVAVALERRDAHAGPRDTSTSFASAGDRAGTLEVISRHQRGTLTLGHDALHDGVLIGRYAAATARRCSTITRCRASTDCCCTSTTRCCSSTPRVATARACTAIATRGCSCWRAAPSSSSDRRRACAGTGVTEPDRVPP